MRHKSRIKRLWGKLTAKERAIAVLRAWKAGEEEDPMVRRKMPREQIREFNRHIRLLQGVNLGLTPLVLMYRGMVEAIRLRLALLGALQLWGMNVKMLLHYIRFECPEAITQTEFDQLQQEATAGGMSLEEAAEILADEYEDWGPDDLESDEGGEEVLTDGAWERVYAEKRAELETLIRNGELAAEETEDRLLINVGSFYGWKGEQVPVTPEWTTSYDIRPDHEGETVELRREWLEYVLAISRSAPMLCWQMPGPHCGPSYLERVNAAQDLGVGDELGKTLMERVRSDIEGCWSQLQALELVLQEVAEVFGGEDPLPSELREILDASAQELKDLWQECQRYTGSLELPGASGDMAKELRKALRSS